MARAMANAIVVCLVADLVTCAHAQAGYSSISCITLCSQARSRISLILCRSFLRIRVTEAPIEWFSLMMGLSDSDYVIWLTFTELHCEAVLC